MSYNLLDEKWLMIENTDRELESISLKDLAGNPDKYIRLSFPFPGHNLAALRFLISLIYAFNHPEDIDSWFGMYEGNPFQPVDKFDNLVRPYLDLMDKDYPFMQATSIDFSKPINASLPQFPAESGSTFFQHENVNVKIGIDVAPIVLLNAQFLIPKMAGAGYPKTINGIPLYLYIQGENLKQTIMLNTLHKSFIKTLEIPYLEKECNIKDILYEIQEKMKPDEVSITAGLNWRSRRICLEYKMGNIKCSLTGDNANRYVEKINYRPGLKYGNENSFWWDSMVVRNTKQNENRIPDQYNVEAHRFLPVWKGYTSILLGKKQNKTESDKPLVLKQYDSLYFEDKNALPNNININAFGYIYKSGGKAYNGFIEDRLYYSKDIAKSEELRSAVDYAITKTNDAAGALHWALKNLKRDGKKPLGKIMNEGEVYQYWRGLESKFKDYLNMLTNKETVTLKDDWVDTLIKYTWKEFNRLASGLELSFLELAHAKQKLSGRLYNLFTDYYKRKN